MTAAPAPRDVLVSAARARVLYAAVWSRADADDVRAQLPSDALTGGRVGALWALLEHHDATAEPWSADGPDVTTWSGPRRVLAILATAASLDIEPGAVALSDDAATMAAARRVAVAEHGLALAAVAPADGWPLDVATAVRVLNLAPALDAYALAVAQLDMLAGAVLPTSSATATRRRTAA